jgi:hypothetical protein
LQLPLHTGGKETSQIGLQSIQSHQRPEPFSF